MSSVTIAQWLFKIFKLSAVQEENIRIVPITTTIVSAQLQQEHPPMEGEWEEIQIHPPVSSLGLLGMRYTSETTDY